jgi:hypothetical protein
MATPNEALVRHNFYTNKLDASAWNTINGLPSSVGMVVSGSRRALLEARKEQLRTECRNAYEKTQINGIPPRYSKISLISNMALEN